MDRMRQEVEATVRRIAVTGLLLVVTVVTLLGKFPRLAVDSAVLLLGLETVILWQLGNMAHRLPGRARAWLPGLDGRRRAQFHALLAETFRIYAQRFLLATTLVAGADMAIRYV